MGRRRMLTLTRGRTDMQKTYEFQGVESMMGATKVKPTLYEGRPVPHATPESEAAAMKFRIASAAVAEAAEAMAEVRDAGPEWPARYRWVTKVAAAFKGAAEELERRR